MAIWTKAAPGIRYREHPTRTIGRGRNARPDRYFTVRYTLDGTPWEEKLGWETEGWTVTKAQKKRGELLDNQQTGKGPTTMAAEAAIAKELRDRPLTTVNDLWLRYFDSIIAVNNKANTAREKQRMWKRRIQPKIGTKAVDAVTEADVGSIVTAPYKRDGDDMVIGGKGEAGNLYRLMHHMFTMAIAWKLRDRALGNPLEDLDEPKTKRRERLLTGKEIGALRRALDEAEEQHNGAPQIVAVIRLAILTGARIGELRNLRHLEIRRDEMELHLPDTKTGFSRRPISKAALAVIDSVERMPGVEYVFRSIVDPTKPLLYDTVEKAFRSITRNAGVLGCSLHTIRHWFATMTANSVNNPRVGMALTGHKSHAAYMNYVHGDKEQARALAEQLAALATGLGATEPNVVDLPGKRR
jgi:integrase